VSARLARLALRLYPAAYRRRYGEEMEALLEDGGTSAGATADLFRGALGAHLRPEPGVTAALGREERLRHGLGAALACWLLFAVAGLAFYKTTEGVPFEGVPGVPGALGSLHLAIQVLAVVGAVAALLAATPFVVAALRSRGDRGAHGPLARSRAAGPAPDAAGLPHGARGVWGSAPDPRSARRGPRAALRPRMSVICAAVLAGAMVEIAALTAAYLVAIITAAPHLAGEPNGPFGTPDVAVSLAIQLVAMIPLAAAATLVAARTWRTAAIR
jgi:hypothetical protein